MHYNHQCIVGYCNQTGIVCTLVMQMILFMSDRIVSIHKQLCSGEEIADKISNISVSGNGVLVEQLKQIFVPQK